MIDDTHSWSAFQSRCLIPIVNCEAPIVDHLIVNNNFIDPTKRQENDQVFVSATGEWAIIIGGYEHKKVWYQSVRLERARGVEDEYLLGQLRAWSRKEMQEGKYVSGQNAAKGTLARRSTGWRTPSLEIYCYPPSETNGRYAQLWETYT